MTKTVIVVLITLFIFAIVAASGCSETKNTTENVTSVSGQVPNLTNNSMPEHSVQVYPVNTSEINESIEEAENLTSPRIVNATYVKPPQPADREASEQSYTPINFNNSYENTPVPSGSQSAYRLKITPANNSSTLIVNDTALVGNPQRALILAQNRTSSNGTVIVKHDY